MHLFKRTSRDIVKNKLAYILILPAVLLMCCIILYPLFKVFWMSFFDIEPMYHTQAIFSGVKNYLKILNDSNLWSTLLQTAYWTFGSVIIQFVLGFVAALILSETFRGRGLARSLLLIPWAMPSVVGALAWKWMYHGQYGLINHILQSLHIINHDINWLGSLSTAMVSVIITNSWRGFPFMMLMLLAGFQNISREVYDASAVDGASFWQQLWYIILPLLKPVIFVVILLAGIWTFNNFTYIYILTGGGPAGKTDILVTFVYKQGFEYFHFGYAATLSVVLFLVVLALSLAYIKLMRLEGLK